MRDRTDWWVFAAWLGILSACCLMVLASGLALSLIFS